MTARVLATETKSPAAPSASQKTWPSPSAKTGAPWVLAALVLFLAYIRLSETAPVNSDGAANILQVLDMLHGNVLLHGWWLSDVSFYTTELPQYALIEAILGPVPAVIHVAAAMTYTLVIVLAALLAKGQATGREGAIRMLITAGIMLAPQPGGDPRTGGGVFVLDLSLGHIGTSIPLLLTWLVIDRFGARRWVPVVVGVLLAWALIADELVLLVGIVPVVAVCGMRAYRTLFNQRQPVASAWFEIALAGAAIAAVPAAATVLAAVQSLGGFEPGAAYALISSGLSMPTHMAVTFESVLVLFGADFFNLPVGFPAIAAVLHLTGLAMAACAVWLGVRRLVRRPAGDSLVIDFMVVAILVNLAAYSVTFATRPSFARDIAVVLPFAAVLAGRLLTGRLMAARMLPALAAVLACYLLSLAHGLIEPAAPPQNAQLASWLVSHGFRYGLGPYWQASSVTLASSQRVQVTPVDDVAGGLVGTYPWEAEKSWYDPSRHHATFLVLADDHHYPHSLPYVTYSNAVTTFGEPAQTFKVGKYQVLVWRKNLLADLHCTIIPKKPGARVSAAGRFPCG